MIKVDTYFHSSHAFKNLYPKLAAQYGAQKDRETDVLLIPAEVRSEEPIIFDQIFKQKKLLIILQAGASVTIHEECLLSDVEIHLQSGAQLVYQTIALDASEKNITVVLEGKHARASVTCTYLLNTDQTLTISTRQEHRASASESSVVLRGALTDQASVVHRGTIFVPKNITGVRARQENKTILLSCGSRVDSSPELEVLNQNVQCSHGSAVGQLDREQLLYVCSRGLPEDCAKRLLLESFLIAQKEQSLATNEGEKKRFERLTTKLREML